MILAKCQEVINNSRLDEFGEAMPDSRLTETSNNKTYRLREAILLSKKLGRPLTIEEMEQFTIAV